MDNQEPKDGALLGQGKAPAWWRPWMVWVVLGVAAAVISIIAEYA